MGDRGSSAMAQKGGAERLEWVDIARAIGIVAVVVGHVWTRGPLRDAMYSFHMPLFFLLSGYLSKPQPMAAFTLRQIGSQMRPYAAFLALLIAADQIIEPLKGNRPIFRDWPADLGSILFGGTALNGPFVIFWFIPCLMVARILFNAVIARWPDPLGRHWLPVMLLALATAYATGMWTNISPLGLLTVPMAFVLLWAGAVGRMAAWRSWMIVPLALLSAAGLSVMLPTLNMKVGDYGWPMLSIASAVATSLLLFRLSLHIAAVRILPLGSWLGQWGRASLVIMYLHVPVIHYLTPYMGKSALLAIGLLGPFAAWHLVRRCRPLARIFL